jgi:chromosome segregation ATPase
MEQIKQGLQTLEECLAKQENKQRIKQNNLRVEELEKIMDDLLARLDEIEPKLTTKHKETRQEVREKLEQIGIEIAEMRFNYSDLIRPQPPLKLMFKPLNNPKQDEPNERKHEAYKPHRTRTVYTRRLSRYTPIF